MSKKITSDEFVNKANEIHNNKYDYSKVEYIDNYSKVKIICPIHGEFEQKPNNHLKRKQGCVYCGGRYKFTINDFISKSYKIHGNKYDYSLVNYRNASSKIKIICPLHGEFEQTPSSHTDQQAGCPKCSKKYKYTNDEFVNKANEIHNNKYDYSKVKYINNYTKIEIICKIHGIFSQTPSNHLSGKGCQDCSNSKNENLISLFLDKEKINYATQHKFNDCMNIRKLPFDFYIPKYNTCIEFNGKQHYEPIDFFGGIRGFEKQKKRDKIKIKYCLDNNIKLITIKYNENISEILSKLVLLWD
jgi:hypothetical protein